MNVNQKTVVLVGIIVVVIMGLIPPWWAPSSDTSDIQVSKGYSPIFNPPDVVSKVNVPRLIMQWAAVVLVVRLLLTLKNRQR